MDTVTDLLLSVVARLDRTEKALALVKPKQTPNQGVQQKVKGTLYCFVHGFNSSHLGCDCKVMLSDTTYSVAHKTAQGPALIDGKQGRNWGIGVDVDNSINVGSNQKFKLNNVLVYPTSTPILPDDDDPIADSGASHSFFSAHDSHLLQNRRQDSTMIVTFPNGSSATSIESGTYQPALGIIPIPATVFNDQDINRSLIGLSDLCHDGQEVRLTETSMEIIKQESTLLRSAKLPTDRLWTFPRPATTTQQPSKDSHLAAHVIRNDLQAANVKFWSAALGSPADTTLIRALSSGFLG